MDLGHIISGLAKTFGSFFLIWITFAFAKFWPQHSYSESLKKKDGKSAASIAFESYVQFAGFVIMLSFAIWAGYGTHQEGGDGYRDSGETVVDFEPSDKERDEYGLTTFLTLFIPGMVGVWIGSGRIQQRADRLEKAAKAINDGQPWYALDVIRRDHDMNEEAGRLMYRAAIANEALAAKTKQQSDPPKA